MLFANMGVPMVCVTIPTMLIALFPIAWIESLVYRSSLDLPRKDAFWGAFSANLWSTLLGIPIVWLPLVIAQMAMGGGRAWGMETPAQRLDAVTLQAAWLIPYQDHLAWMIPTASLVLLLPFYFGSVVVEHWVLCNRWQPAGRKPSFGVVMLANALTYFGLSLYYCGQLWFQASGSPL